MMEKISSFIKKKRVLLIFLIFFLLLLLQYQFLYLYHDDYGYASLSYAVDIGNEGLHYGISDILIYKEIKIILKITNKISNNLKIIVNSLISYCIKIVLKN